jgi:hypothetical protein
LYIKAHKFTWVAHGIKAGLDQTVIKLYDLSEYTSYLKEMTTYSIIYHYKAYFILCRSFSSYTFCASQTSASVSVTNFMQQSSSEANSRSTCQEIPMPFIESER